MPSPAAQDYLDPAVPPGYLRRSPEELNRAYDLGVDPYTGRSTNPAIAAGRRNERMTENIIPSYGVGGEGGVRDDHLKQELALRTGSGSVYDDPFYGGQHIHAAAVPRVLVPTGEARGRLRAAKYEADRPQREQAQRRLADSMAEGENAQRHRMGQGAGLHQQLFGLDYEKPSMPQTPPPIDPSLEGGERGKAEKVYAAQAEKYKADLMAYHEKTLRRDAGDKLFESYVNMPEADKSYILRLPPEARRNAIVNHPLTPRSPAPPKDMFDTSTFPTLTPRVASGERADAEWDDSDANSWFAGDYIGADIGAPANG